MANVTLQEMAGKLMAEGFSRSGPAAQALSDPLTDTPDRWSRSTSSRPYRA